MSTNGSSDAKTIVLITGAKPRVSPSGWPSMAPESLIHGSLGYYAAQQMASKGHHILIGSRDSNKAHKAIESLVADGSVKVSKDNLEPIQIDVTSDDSIKAAAQTISDKYGRLDILMNNAGIAQAQAASEDGKGPTLRELYQSHYDTNLFGAAVTTDVFLPLLRKSTVKGGKRDRVHEFWVVEPDVGGKGGVTPAASYPIYRSTKTAMSMIMVSAYLTSIGFKRSSVADCQLF